MPVSYTVWVRQSRQRTLWAELTLIMQITSAKWKTLWFKAYAHKLYYKTRQKTLQGGLTPIRVDLSSPVTYGLGVMLVRYPISQG